MVNFDARDRPQLVFAYEAGPDPLGWTT